LSIIYVTAFGSQRVSKKLITSIFCGGRGSVSTMGVRLMHPYLNNGDEKMIIICSVAFILAFRFKTS
jgi:hypothetical protein